MRTRKLGRSLTAPTLAVLIAAGVVAAQPPSPPPSGPPQTRGPIVDGSVQHDVSPALTSIPPISPAPGAIIREVQKPRHSRRQGPKLLAPDPVLQSTPGALGAPTPTQNFEGLANVDGVLPPDTNGDIGPNHYVQWVNLSFAIFSRTGQLLYGPAAGNTLWAGFGGPCQDTNNGDPIVLHDPLADRWVFSQLALPNGFDGPFYQCVAVSTGPDPTGSYHRYAFLIHATKLNDYPKLGVWPDGYYLAVNQFTLSCILWWCSEQWAGQRVVAFERAAMLQGQPAGMVAFELDPNANLGGMLPADLDGPPPPAGTPAYFAQVDDDEFDPGLIPEDRLQVWAFHVDWASPAASTFAQVAELPVAPFSSSLCGWNPCVPQPDPDVLGDIVLLDTLADRLMYRLQYRNFGTHQTLVTNHTVDVGGDRAGIRWYELRDPGSGWSIFQQGTFAPADEHHRWMGSIAMDGGGNIALGYSISSLTKHPSIRYVGRMAGDPPNTMTVAEQEIVAGGGSQFNSEARWGDYSMMAVDPVDDRTFWYTQEYYAFSEPYASANWQTRIAAFKLTVLPALSISDAAAGEPGVATFTVTLSAASTETVTVGWATGNGTATAGSDYTAGSNTLTFSPGETSKPVSITILPDALDEPDETFVVNLSGAANATLADAQGVGTIADDDAPPTLSVNDRAELEGTAGPQTLTFTVSLSAPSGKVVTVGYATANGTAQAGSDYVAAAGTLTFNPGQTTQSIGVTVNGDTVEESDETFVVNLSGPVNATLADAQGVGTIRNDDGAVPASLTVVAPNGGQSWKLRTTQTIQWTSTGLGGNVMIQLSRDGGATWTTLFSSTPNDGSQSWRVSGKASARCLIRITSLASPAVSDASDGLFAIVK